MLEVFLDALIDSLKLLPFLFVTYLIMGFFEYAASEKSKKIISKAGRFGPLWGGLLGAFPQCGFSAAASNFYVGRIITLGTLISIYLSTSDEMLPIFISEKVPFYVIIKILATKAVIGMISGFLIEFVFGWLAKRNKTPEGFTLDEDLDCHCGGHILGGAIYHTAKVFIFVFAISFVINMLIFFVGEDTLSSVISDVPVLGEMLAGLVGLIPNCAASVVITQLYLEGIIGAGPMISGLLVSAGMGLLVLFEENRHLKENLIIVGILYGISVGWGLLIEVLGITF